MDLGKAQAHVCGDNQSRGKADYQLQETADGSPYHGGSRFLGELEG